MRLRRPASPALCESDAECPDGLACLERRCRSFSPGDVDAEVPCPCPRPPAGCHYQPSPESCCGTLVCDDGGSAGADAGPEDAGAARCASNDECAPDQRCDRAGCLGLGVCVARPSDCPPADPIPVCACDGRTHESACEAARDGLSLASDPAACVACTPDGGECGPGMRCENAGCGATSGTCVAEVSCDADVRDPVCGCDGVTYRHRCALEGSGTPLDHAGACGDDCGAPPETCCYADYDCPGAERCLGGICEPDGRRGEGRCVAPLAPGECWNSSECAAGEGCSGASVPACGGGRPTPGRCGPPA